MNKQLLLGLTLIGAVLAFETHAASEWNAQDYALYPGDFDGDGRTDILYIAKDPLLPSGIARSDGNGPNIAWQSWPSNYLGIPSESKRKQAKWRLHTMAAACRDGSEGISEAATCAQSCL